MHHGLLQAITCGKPFTELPPRGAQCEESQFAAVANRVLVHPIKVVELANNMVQKKAQERKNANDQTSTSILLILIVLSACGAMAQNERTQPRFVGLPRHRENIQPNSVCRLFPTVIPTAT